MTVSITRRPLLGALLAAAGAAPFAASARAEDNEVVSVSTGGAYGALLKKYYYDPFTAATGIRVRMISASTSEAWAKLRAMEQTGNVEWDLLSALDTDRVSQRDLLESVDCSKIPQAAAQGIPNACQSNLVTRVIGTGASLIYSTKAFPEGGPQTWAEFWDTQRFPGPRGMQNSGTPWAVLSIALLADGVQPKDLYPLDLDRAFRKMDALKPHVAVWWRTGDQSQQILRDGEVVASVVWSGRGFMLEKEHVPVQMVLAGSIMMNGYWAIARNAPHRENAYKLIDFFMTRPEAHLGFMRENYNETSNRKVVDLMTPEERKSAITAPENWNTLIIADFDWVGRNEAMILERWNRWISS
jgi:mannopine transport system substrate-binding protein